MSSWDQNIDVGYAYAGGSGVFVAQILITRKNLYDVAREMRYDELRGPSHAEITSLTYTAYMLDDKTRGRTPVFAHENIEVDIQDAIFEYPRFNSFFRFPGSGIGELGFNFMHEPIGNPNPLFPKAERNYQVEYRLDFVPALSRNPTYLKFRIRAT